MTRAGNAGVLFIEGRAVVRALGTGGTPSDALLTAPASVELTGLAADPSFASTRIVYVGEAETLPDGAREFTIARYRLVGDALGERAAIVTGINLPHSGDAVFQFDAVRGYLYVAVPAADDGARDPYASRILRFNADGTVPQTNRAASPVVAYGYGRPTALTLDGRGRLWLAGTGAPWSQPLAVIDPNAPSADWPAVPQSIALPSSATPAGVSGLAMVSGKPGEDSRLIVLSPDRLTALPLTPAGAGAPIVRSLAAHGRATAVLAGDAGTLVVAFASAGGDVRISGDAALARFQAP